MRKPFNPDAPIDPKLLRKLKREAKAKNPELYRVMRRMTTDQLRELEREIREDELRQLRRMRKNDPDVQAAIADHVYHLRCLDELRHWQNYYKNLPRKQIPRRRPAPVAEVLTQPVQTFWPAELLSDLALAPKLKPQPEPELPDNFYGKFFHSTDDYSVW